MINLGIYTIFTGEYVKFFDKFMESLNNFFPDDEKELIILSDALTDKDNTRIGKVHIRVRKLINYPYPYINMNKFQILYEYNKEFGFDHIAYFDSDTIFFERGHEFWETLKKDVESYKILVSYHPFYLDTYAYNKYGGKMDNFMLIETPNFQERTFRSYDDTAYNNFDFINENNCWLITSFFIIESETLEEFAMNIKTLINKSNREYIYNLKLSDESHFNLIYYFDYLNKNTERYCLGEYISNDPNYESKNDDVFICQKYNDKSKSASKYSSTGNIILLYIDDNFDPEFLYKLYSKYIYNFTFMCISNDANASLLNYVFNRYMFKNKLYFWDVWFGNKNILFNKELYEVYLPEGYAVDIHNIVFIRKPDEQILNVDFNKLVKSNIQYKSDKTIEENKDFNNISYMYYTDEFIKQHYDNEYDNK